MKKSLGRRLNLFLLPLLVAVVVRLWYATCKVRLHNTKWCEEAEQSGSPVVRTCWHYCVLGIFAVYRRNPLVIMVSGSKDGEYLARLMEKLNFSVVRGSSNRNGAQAAKQLIRELRNGKNCGLVADGSQGPAKVAQSGPLLIAGRTGGVVLPMAYSANRYFTFNTWDRLILPKPFSTIDVYYGQPLTVPAEVKANDLEEYRDDLEKRLNTLYDSVWALQGKTSH